MTMYRRYGRYLTHGLIPILLFLLFPFILIFFPSQIFLFFSLSVLDCMYLGRFAPFFPFAKAIAASWP